MELEKSLESPLGYKEIKSINPKRNQFWIFIGGTDADIETPIIWPPDAKNWLIGKIPVAGKDWRQEEKWTTEDEIVGWHQQLDGLECEQALGVGDGQGSLGCCSPWSCKELDMTEQLNWTDKFMKLITELWLCERISYSHKVYSEKCLGIRGHDVYDLRVNGSGEKVKYSYIEYVNDQTNGIKY